MEGRPDYSEYVAHFTSAVDVEGNPAISAMDPLHRLASILQERKVRATKKHWSLGGPSAAFTECPWTSLMSHAERYSSYGIGFTKQHLWDRGGAPALYMRSETLRDAKEHIDAAAKRSVTPAIPPSIGTFYTPIERESGWKTLSGGEVDKAIDYAHEREWRVPTDLDFQWTDVIFIVVARFSDAEQLPAEAVAAIGEGSILSMDNYHRIEQLWPTHRL